MSKLVFSTYGHSPALVFARNALRSWGYCVADDTTTATHVILPVPSFDSPGIVKGGLPIPSLTDDAVLIGGNLPLSSRKQVDLLKDPYYLLENAAITAQCAIQYATLAAQMPVLVIGWGRIGKHLAPLLTQHGAIVTVAVRSDSTYAAVKNAGFIPVFLSELVPTDYAVIFNTAPAPILHRHACRPDAQLIDLASVRGIEGENVIWARGLPGKDAPELSGTLIAKTALRYALEGGSSV